MVTATAALSPAAAAVASAAAAIAVAAEAAARRRGPRRRARAQRASRPGRCHCRCERQGGQPGNAFEAHTLAPTPSTAGSKEHTVLLHGTGGSENTKALATMIVNTLRGNLQVVEAKAAMFGHVHLQAEAQAPDDARKKPTRQDLEALTGAEHVGEEAGVQPDNAPPPPRGQQPGDRDDRRRQ